MNMGGPSRSITSGMRIRCTITYPHQAQIQTTLGSNVYMRRTNNRLLCRAQIKLSQYMLKKTPHTSAFLLDAKQKATIFRKTSGHQTECP